MEEFAQQNREDLKSTVHVDLLDSMIERTIGKLSVRRNSYLQSHLRSLYKLREQLLKKETDHCKQTANAATDSTRLSFDVEKPQIEQLIRLFRIAEEHRSRSLEVVDNKLEATCALAEFILKPSIGSGCVR
jgi:hypothetical protein